MLFRFGNNVRHALRTAVRQPAVAITIVLTLAVGTGATIAIFSVVDAALLRPLPYPRPDELATIVQQTDEFGTVPFAPPFLDDLRRRTKGLESLAGFSSSGWMMTMTGVGQPRVVSAAYVSDGLLDLLGVRPAAGRFFVGDEHTPTGARAAVVSSSLWASTFGETVAPSGQVVQLAGEPYRVVGVLPADFRLPITGSIVSAGQGMADLVLPFAGHWAANVRVVPIMHVVGRVAAGSSIAAADAEIGALRAGLDAEFPEAELASRLRVLSLSDLVSRPSRAAVLMLFAAAALLLLTACVNVANLMLARATSRRQEIAVRTALGAGRARLAEQALTEALVFAWFGCGAGFLLATWLLSAVPRLGLQSLPPSAQVGVDARVAAFATLLAVACAAGFGLLPMLYSWRVTPAGRLRAASGGVAAPARRALVVGEVALAVVLLAGAGLLVSSFMRLSRVDPGFRTHGLLAVPLSIADAGYADAGARGAFMTDLVERLEAISGVDGVAAVNRLPLGGSNVLVGVEAEGRTIPEGTSNTVDRRVITPGYFRLMGIDVVAGRSFVAADDAQSPFGAAIVNRAAARLFWSDGEVVGRRLRLMLRGGPGPWLTVVGLVDDVRHHDLGEAPRPEVYVPYQQASVETMVALVRAADGRQLEADAAAGDIAAAVRATVWDLEPDLPMDRMTGVAEVVSASVAEPRLRTAILATFAGLALALAAIGIAGIVSYSVVQRRRDIAVRIALGARHENVLWHTVREGLGLGIAGAVVGLLVAVPLARLLDSLLFEVEAHDPATFMGVAVLLVVIVGVASYLPARRATRVDPIGALRSE